MFSTHMMNSSGFFRKIDCPIYKVASFEMTDLSLIKRISLTKKPIISTGMASLDEIKNSKFAKKSGIKDITLLYCVSNYPSKIEDLTFTNIEIMKILTVELDFRTFKNVQL